MLVAPVAPARERHPYKAGNLLTNRVAPVAPARERPGFAKRQLQRLASLPSLPQGSVGINPLFAIMPLGRSRRSRKGASFTMTLLILLRNKSLPSLPQGSVIRVRRSGACVLPASLPSLPQGSVIPCFCVLYYRCTSLPSLPQGSVSAVPTTQGLNAVAPVAPARERGLHVAKCEVRLYVAPVAPARERVPVVLLILLLVLSLPSLPQGSVT